MTERQREILGMLDARRAVSVRELSSALYVSEATIRRDMAILEKAGALRRVHGGALPAGCEGIVPLMMRDGEHSAQKERIARRARSWCRTARRSCSTRRPPCGGCSNTSAAGAG